MSQRSLKIDCMNNLSRECFLQWFLHVNPVQHHHIAGERTHAGRHLSSTAELTLALSGFIEHAHINTYIISDHHGSMSVNINIKFASQDCLSSIKHRQDLSSAPSFSSAFVVRQKNEEMTSIGQRSAFSVCFCPSCQATFWIMISMQCEACLSP